jgi:hypothetical protein
VRFAPAPGRQGRLRLTQCRLERARVELEQRLSRENVLSFVDRHRVHRPAHLRLDRYRLQRLDDAVGPDRQRCGNLRYRRDLHRNGRRPLLRRLGACRAGERRGDQGERFSEYEESLGSGRHRQV